MAELTQARAIEYFNYDEATGALIKRLRPKSEFKNAAAYASHLKLVGKPSGARNSNGYIKVCIDGHYYTAHRVIFLMMTAAMPKYPEYEIDHINGDPGDNRWCNLRLVTKSENQRNARMRGNNTSGVHGVNIKRQQGRPDKWVARIWSGPRHVHLGTFTELRDATIARKAAERVLNVTRSDVPSSTPNGQ